VRRAIAALSLLSLGACAGQSPTVPGARTQAFAVSTIVTPGWVWGVTTDDVANNTVQQTQALAAYSKRTMIRTVFDQPQNGAPVARDYVASISKVSGAADILGLTIDSSNMAALSLATVKARISEYLSALGGLVSVWEVGNELNGNWLGSGVMPKVNAQYDAVKAAGKQTAITFYYENPPTPGHDMIPWIDANIPVGHRIRAGLNYALVSYYEDQNAGHQLSQTELNTMFAALHARFPNAKLGFGECGYGGKLPPGTPGGNAQRAALLQRFYGYRVPTVPAYVGGLFYWNWNHTAVPINTPDWRVLSALIK
jgi:hypothetical protein